MLKTINNGNNSNTDGDTVTKNPASTTTKVNAWESVIAFAQNCLERILMFTSLSIYLDTYQIPHPPPTTTTTHPIQSTRSLRWV
eukprot:m.8284 g.8284  ORF g.8284 m.8284 type:complete len:84 (-) comp6697_c0_seq1:48-299(-)